MSRPPTVGFTLLLIAARTFLALGALGCVGSPPHGEPRHSAGVDRDGRESADNSLSDVAADLVRLWKADPASAERCARSMVDAHCNDSHALREAAAILCASPGDLDGALTLIQSAQARSGTCAATRYVEACIYYARWEYKATAKAINALLSDHPEDVEVLVLASHIQWRRGARLIAIQLLERAYENSPDRPDIAYRLARYCMQAGSLEAATRYIERASSLLGQVPRAGANRDMDRCLPSQDPLRLIDMLDITPEQLDVWLSQTLIRQRRFEVARAILARIAARGGSNTRTLWSTAVMDQTCDRTREAKATFACIEQMAIADQRPIVSANAALRGAACSEELGDREGALEDYRRIDTTYFPVLSMPTRQRVAGINAGRISLLSSDATGMPVEVLPSEYADDCLITAADSILAYWAMDSRIATRVPRSQSGLGSLLATCIDAVRSASDCQVYCTVWDDDLMRQLLNAGIPVVVGIPICGASEYTQHAYIVVGVDFQADCILVRDTGSQHLVRSLPLSAVRQRRIVIILPPAKARSLTHLPLGGELCSSWNEGEKLLMQGDGVGAETIFRRALAIDDTLPELWLRLADSIAAQDKRAAAIDAYREAAMRADWDIPTLCIAGVRLLFLGDLAFGLRSLERVLAAEPANQLALTEGAFALLLEGSVSRARAYIDRLEALGESSPDLKALCAIRSVLADSTDLTNAFRDLRVCTVDGQRNCAWLYLARAYELRGDLDSAIECAERYRTSAANPVEIVLADRELSRFRSRSSASSALPR